MSELLSWTADEDAAILHRWLPMHAPCADPRILDVTANRGQMWKGSGYTPTVRVDIDQADQRPDVWADCRALPFAAGSFDVITFDPPHIPGPSSRHGSRPDWQRNYGMGQLPSAKANGVELLFTPFLREARRVLVPGGIILAKIADGVYQDRMRFHHVAFIRRAERLIGLTPCDLRVKIRDQPGTPWRPDRTRQLHCRAALSYWIVVRKGGCQGHGVRRPARPAQGALWGAEVGG